MKIAIISEFNRNSVNYGNRLQAMALNTYIRENFPDYEIKYLYFDFWDHFIITKKKSLLEKITDVYGAFLRHIMLKAKTAEGINERLKVCDNFSVKTMDLAESAYTWQDLQDSDFDAVIIGSDVVWAQGNGKIGRIRFLDFDSKTKYRKISYAASFGRDWIPEENVSEIQRCLNEFYSISVRENSSVTLLDNIGIKAVHVVDPTLLLSRNQWINYEEKPDSITDKYVFVYLLGASKEMRRDISEWAHSINISIVTIPHVSGKINDADIEFGDIKITDCSPGNWLWLIDHAEFVLTDSFHGSVFSTIFEKRMCVLERTGKININNRMIDFMKMIEQKDKIMPSNHLKSLNGMNWNYSRTREILDKKINFSKSYLRNALIFKER